ncbi:hypothetical protein GCM10009682_00010 [Luedemannella flava]|uniref:SCP domain-containing protein n=1 Tax=Luedemannella flava TaxID=349316 RepID=A0ABP4XG72_9ACTN
MMKRVLAATVAVAVVLLTGAASCEPGASVVDGSASLEESNMLALVNQKRALVNCPALTRDQKLSDAAYRHATDMRDNNVKQHTGSDGSTPASRIAEAGFTPASRTGEIMYWSDAASDYKAAVAWWLNSPPHKEIIENCAFTHAGFGVLYPDNAKYYAVGDFAAH